MTGRASAATVRDVSTLQLRIVTVVGGLLVALALALGQERLEYGDRGCGSGFNPASSASSVSDSIIYGRGAAAGCRDATSERQSVALGVGGLGVVLLGAGLYGIRRNEKADSS